MQVYEISYLVLPSIPEEKLSTVVDSIKQVVSKEGGKEFDGEAPFKHPLSYKMSKTVGASRYVVSDAYIGWIKFEIEPSNIAGIKAGMEKISEVLRFLIVKTPQETSFTFAKAKALLKEKEDKENEKEEVQTPVDETGVAAEIVVE